MEDKQINRWLRRRFSPLGWTLLGYYLILNLIVIALMAADMAAGMLRSFASGNWREGIDLNALTGNAWGYILAAAVGLTILYAWKGRDWTARLFVRHKAMKPGTFLALLCLLGGAQMANSLWMGLLEAIVNLFGRSTLPILETVTGDSDTFSMFLYASLAAPVSEELLFRGFVQGSLRPYGKRFSIFGSAFLFALFHGNLLQAPYAFFAGLLLGYTAAEYSLTWAIGLHVFNNLVMADLFARLLDTLSAAAAEVTSLAVFGSMAVISLVLLVKNRGRTREYRRGEWMDSRCLKCFFLSPGILLFTMLMAVNMLALFA